MKVLISALAGRYATQTADSWSLRSFEDEQASTVDDSVISALAVSWEDAEFAESDDPDKCAESAWAKDRAIRLSVLALEDLSDSTSKEVLACLDNLLEIPEVMTFMLNRLTAYELPDSIDTEKLYTYLADLSYANELFSIILENQPRIREIRKRFDNLPLELFKSRDAKLHFRSVAIDAGVFRALCFATPGNIRASIFEAYRSLSALTNSRAIVTQLVSSIKPSRTHIASNVPGLALDEFGEFEHDLQEDISAPERSWRAKIAFGNVLVQQDAVFARLQVGDVSTASKFARQLVESQLEDEDSEHAAMTLCKLAQRAKMLQLHTLQLEWSRWAVELAPNDGIARSQLADALIQMGEFEEAEHALSAAEEMGEELYAANGRARILRDQGELPKAVDAFRSAKAKFGDHPQVFHASVGAAKALRQMGRFDEAIVEYTEALGRFPGTLTLLIGRAGAFAEVGRFDEAFDDFRKALELDPQNAAAMIGLASAYRDCGNLEEAEELFRAILVQYPNDFYSRCGLAELLRVSGRIAEAKEVLAAVLQKFPNAPWARLYLARVQEAEGDFASSKDSYTEVLSQAPLIGQTYIWLAGMLSRAGAWNDARQVLEKGRSLFPDNLHIRRAMGDMFVRLHEWHKAEDEFKVALAKYPHHQRLKNSYAILKVWRGELDAALQFCTPDTHRSVDDWRAYLLQAQVLVRQRKDQEATEHLLKGLREVPFAVEARMMKNLLASIHISKCKYAAALSVVEEGPAEAGNIVKLHAFAASDDKPSARSYFEVIRENMPPFHIDLAEEIAVTFSIKSGTPQHPEGWIEVEERNILLLEAA